MSFCQDETKQGRFDKRDLLIVLVRHSHAILPEQPRRLELSIQSLAFHNRGRFLLVLKLLFEDLQIRFDFLHTLLACFAVLPKQVSLLALPHVHRSTIGRCYCDGNLHWIGLDAVGSDLAIREYASDALGGRVVLLIAPVSASALHGRKRSL